MKRIIGVMVLAATSLIARADEYRYRIDLGGLGTSTTPGNYIYWDVVKIIEPEGGSAYSTPYSNCTAVVRRNGIAIATVNVVSSRTYYRDLDVVAGSTNTYTIAAMGVESNEHDKICELSYEMEVSPVSSMSFSVDGETKTTTISGTQAKWSRMSGLSYSSLNWIARSSAEGSWLTLKQSGDELQATAKRLTSGTARSALINITLGGYVIAQISVIQGDASTCADVTVTDGEGRQISIPGQWFAEYPVLANTYGSNESAAMSDAANGMKVWECFVAGLDPTNANSRFTSTIELENGIPIIRWEPNLNKTTDERIYTIYGRASLDDDDGWTTPTNSIHRFFKVGVEMP